MFNGAVLPEKKTQTEKTSHVYNKCLVYIVIVNLLLIFFCVDSNSCKSHKIIKNIAFVLQQYKKSIKEI